MLKKAGLGFILCLLMVFVLAACGGPSSATLELSNRGESDITLKSVAIGGQVHLEKDMALKSDKENASVAGSSYTTAFSGTDKVPVVLVLYDPALGGTVTYEAELEMPKKKAAVHFKLLYGYGQIVTVTTIE